VEKLQAFATNVPDKTVSFPEVYPCVCHS